MVVGTGGDNGSGGMGSGGDTGQTGGKPGSGGSVGNTGGLGVGGSASGGATPTGGSATGGSATGGSNTGGRATGGGSTGGSAGVGGNAGGAGGVGTGGRGTGGAATGGAATGGTSGPLFLSIDFVGGGAAVAMTATESAGVKSAARWNSAAGATGTLSALVLANGTATTAAATWSAAGSWSLGFTDAPGNVRMMNGYLDPIASTAPATVMVSALPTAITAGGYDVYVYCYTDTNSGETRTGDYKIGSTTFTVVQTGPSATSFGGFVLAPNQGAGNYIVFRNVTGSSFTLTATPSGGTVPRAPVNGIQIVWPAGT